MESIHRLRHALANLFRRDRMNDELREEMAHHLAMAEQRNRAAGMSATEARRAARREFGGTDHLEEAVRDTWGTNLLTSWARDMRHAFTALTKAPAFTGFVVATLGLGIGLTTSMFSFMNFLVLSPIQLPEKEATIRIWRMTPQGQQDRHATSTFVDLERESKGFVQLTGFHFESLTVSTPETSPMNKSGLRVSPAFFEVVGIRPELGRGFTAAESESGGNNVVVLSHATWTQLFAQDPAVLGRQMRINGESVTVVGVMPESFVQPLLFAGAEFYRPLQLSSAERYRSYANDQLQIIGRRLPSHDLPQVVAGLETLFASIVRDHHIELRETTIQVLPLDEATVEPTALPVTGLLVGLAVALLLVACANLASVQLSRVMTRGREFAVRSALGASRRQLVGSLLCEVAILAVLGGGVGLLVAQGINRWLGSIFVAFGVMDLEISIDSTVLFVAFAATVLAGLGFGFFPALSGSRVNLTDALQTDTRTTAGNKTQSRFLRAMIVGQFALVLVLLAAAGYFVRGVTELVGSPAGWNPDKLLQGSITLHESDYPETVDREKFYARALDQIHLLPGVAQVSLSSGLPGVAAGLQGIVVEGESIPEEGREPRAINLTVSLDFFETMQIGLLNGRVFSADDDRQTTPKVIINETMAHTLFADTNPIGKRIGSVDSDDRQWMEIVGVVGDVVYAHRNAEETRFQTYRPLAQDPVSHLTLALRTHGEPEAMAGNLRRTFKTLDPDLVITQLSSVEQSIKDRMRFPIMMSEMMIAFALAGLLLATLGVYGLVARGVASRTTEIGIRMALGAQRRDVLRLVVGSGVRLAVIGVMIGVGATLALKPVLASIDATLPPITVWNTLIPLSTLLMGIAFLASYLPTRRVTKIDPIEALR